jgi:hypothetical protein
MKKIKEIYGLIQTTDNEYVLDGDINVINNINVNHIIGYGKDRLGDEANIFVVFEDNSDKMYCILSEIKIIISLLLHQNKVTQLQFNILGE